MQSLDVINSMLATAGMRPVSSLTGTHRLLPGALDCLNKANRSVQAKAWWFNRDKTELAPDADGFIYVPADCTHIHSDDHDLVLRGRRLLRRSTGNYTFQSPVKVELIRTVPFEDLPEIAATFVAAQAVLAFQRDYDGDSQKTSDLKREYLEARAEINAEETRQAGTNLLDNNPRLVYLKSITTRVRGHYWR